MNIRRIAKINDSAYESLLSILRSSKRFSFESNEDGLSSVLVLESLRTGETIKLDLSLLDSDSIDEIIVDNDEDDDAYDGDDYD